MLKKGFLGTVSDYVSEKTFKNSLAFKKSTKAFNLDSFLKKGEDKDKIAGLFSEWLVFDYKQEIFDGMTGIEYFIKHNPLQFSQFDISGYKQLLSFEVGFFVVKKINIGHGVYIESIASGIEYFVYDVSASFSLGNENTIWGRISEINGTYYFVSSKIFQIPIHMLSGMREVIAGWEKNSLNAKEIVQWVTDEKNLENNIYNNKNEIEIPIYTDLEKDFLNALKKCRMDKMFSLKTYKKWITDEKRFGSQFTANAIMCLMPTNLESKDINELLDTSMNFANMIPRKFLDGKTPLEAKREYDNKKERVFDMNIYSKDKYINKLEKAHKVMKEFEYGKAYKIYEEIITDLLNDKTPFFDVFRIYANAGACCTNESSKLDKVDFKNEFLIYQELVEASLRINPLYDFGLKMKNDLDSINDDYSYVRKGYKKIAKNLRLYEKEVARKKYKKSVFYKYEVFLKRIGVSLEYATVSKIESPRCAKDDEVGHKIGRNDPCYCNSGQKYKKCCGK